MRPAGALPKRADEDVAHQLAGEQTINDDPSILDPVDEDEFHSTK